MHGSSSPLDNDRTGRYCGVGRIILFALQTAPARSYGLNRLRVSLREGAGIDFTTSALDWSLLSGTVELRDVSAARAGNGVPFVRAAGIRAEVDLLSLLREKRSWKRPALLR